MGDEPVHQRASERLKAIAGLAVSGDKVRAAFATKLVAAGLALVCFAGGLDYFSHGEDVQRALAGFARDSGQGAIVDDLAKVEGQMSAWKRAALAFLPTTAPQWVVLVATLPGVCLLAWGLRMKLGSGTQAERASALWDLGRIVLGPGVIGAVAYLLVSLRGFPVLRRTTSSFVGKVRDGALTWSDVASLGAKYHGWTWAEVGSVLVLGVASIVLAIVLGRVSARLNRREDASDHAMRRTTLDVTRRVAWSIGALALFYYAGVTLVATASYGAGLPVVTWPWKVRPATFLLTLALMGLGAGVAWTGRALRPRAAAD